MKMSITRRALIESTIRLKILDLIEKDHYNLTLTKEERTVLGEMVGVR